MFGFMTATNNGVAAYQRALRELREMFRGEFDQLLKHYNALARFDAVGRSADPANYQPALRTTPYNAAIAHLRDERHRAEFDELRESIRSEMDGEVDAAIESIRKEFVVPEPEPATECDSCRDLPYLDHISETEHIRNDICACSNPGTTHTHELHEAVAASERRQAETAVIPLTSYSMALDEIYLLRAILADEARILDEHLDFKTFPLSRRRIAERQIIRMRGMAAGLFEENCRDDFSPKDALRSADVDDCMTRTQWEQQRGLAG